MSRESSFNDQNNDHVNDLDQCHQDSHQILKNDDYSTKENIEQTHRQYIADQSESSVQVSNNDQTNVIAKAKGNQDKMQNKENFVFKVLSKMGHCIELAKNKTFNFLGFKSNVDVKYNENSINDCEKVDSYPLSGVKLNQTKEYTSKVDNKDKNKEKEPNNNFSIFNKIFPSINNFHGLIKIVEQTLSTCLVSLGLVSTSLCFEEFCKENDNTNADNKEKKFNMHHNTECINDCDEKNESCQLVNLYQKIYTILKSLHINFISIESILLFFKSKLLFYEYQPKFNDKSCDSLKCQKELSVTDIKSKVDQQSLFNDEESSQRDCFTSQEINNINLTLKGMNEKQRRQFLFLKSSEIMNGINVVAKLFNVSIATLYKAKKEIQAGDYYILNSKIRAEGGGRAKIEDKNPQVCTKILQLVDPETYGDPSSKLRWTSFSCRKIREELNDDEKVSHSTIGRILSDNGYSRKKIKNIMNQANLYHSVILICNLNSLKNRLVNLKKIIVL